MSAPREHVEPCDLHRDVLRTLSNPAKFPHLSDDDALAGIEDDLVRNCGACCGRTVKPGQGRDLL